MSTDSPARVWRRAAAAITAVVVVAVSAAACSQDSSGPAVTNAADAAVTVRSADGEVVSDIDPDGGAMVLTDDCLEAPLVVTYAGGEEIIFDAPVCPGQELLIQNSLVRLVEPSYEHG